MSEPLRVFHLTTAGDEMAGAEQLLLGLAQLADRSRWNLEFCTLTPRGTMHDALAAAGWPVHALDVTGFASLPAGLGRLREVLAAFRPDVLHAHLSHASIVGAVAAGLDRRLVLLQTRHYSDYIARFRTQRAPLDGWAARRCERIIAVSDAARTQLVTGEGVWRSRVTVVENGVEWQRLASLDHDDGRRRLEALGVPRGFKIGCAATFNIRKGHTYLLQAMVRVGARYPNAHLVLLGTGAEEAITRADVERLGLTDRVYFLGHRDDAHRLLAGLDVYVQPSIEEGFGLAVIEAMAMRRPVVVSAVGGMLQTVDPGRTGLRVPAAEPIPLADAILTLIENPERAATLGKNASEHVRTHYSLQRMLGEYDDVYRGTVARAASQRS